MEQMHERVITLRPQRTWAGLCSGVSWGRVLDVLAHGADLELRRGGVLDAVAIDAVEPNLVARDVYAHYPETTLQGCIA